MHVLSFVFSALNIFSPPADTTYTKLHIEIDGTSANVVRIRPPYESLRDSALYAPFENVSGSKTFDLRIPLKASTFIVLDINREFYYPLALSLGDSVSLKVRRTQQFSNPSYQCQVSGTNAAAHEIYRSRFFPAGQTIHRFADLAKQSTTYSSYYVSSKKYIDSLTTVWDSLRQKEMITPDAYTLYMADTKGVMYDEAIRKMASVKTKDSSWQSYMKWNNLRTVMFYHSQASNPILLNTYYGSQLHESYLKSILKEDDAITDTVLRSTVTGFYFYFDSLKREEAWGKNFWYMKKLYPTTNHRLDSIDLAVYRSYFPQSVYLKKIDRFQDSMVNERKVLFGKVDIHEKPIAALTDAFASLNGRYFFIDVWATWCGPCIQEFNYFTKVSTFFKKKEIAEVFISIDREEDRTKWRNYITAQNVSGSHFFAGKNIEKELLNVITKEQSQGGALSIPRYLLYDKTLNKYYVDLPRPSSGEVLESFITDILQKN
ncbi:MAG: redoxin family protein [Bacteroidota bacterium]